MLNLLKKESLPFEVNVKLGVNTSKVKPFYVDVKVNYRDRNFKKLMTNVFKENKYVLEYEFAKENKGKPIYGKTISVNLKKLLKRDHDTVKEGSSVMVNSLMKRRVHFENAEEGRLFANEVREVLVDLLHEYYNQYEKVNDEAVEFNS